jgi:alanyl-tRNA synthetase
VPKERIVRFGRSDNWWPKVRWEGPCGPCSEVHIDLGEALGCDKPTCAVGCDCNRYLELWNVVFQQYTEAEDGTLTPLPKPGVDTGMGLERLAMVMQGKAWSMETDELWAILTRAREALSDVGGAPGAEYGGDEETDIALRVIADHVRAIAFLMADGATPSNDGPGYVVRRLIRRAHRFGRSLGATDAFLYAALPTVAQACGEAYPELLPKRDFSAKVVHSEEERFGRALGRGLQEFERLRRSLQAAGESVIPGEEAFALTATYGLPVEVTEELAQDVGLTIDRGGFEAAMAAHAKRSSGERKGLQIHSETADLPETEFLGYDSLEAEASVTALRRDGQSLDSVGKGEEAEVVLDGSPFYPERGGQVGDTGTLEALGLKGLVTDVSVGAGDAFIHLVRIAEGTLSVGDRVAARVDADRRHAIMRHHTATHLLQAALRQTLGVHVTQQGSLVAPDRLRFDFTHHDAMRAEELAAVEDQVNEWVLADIPVVAEEKPLEQAKAEGAMAIFGEKYGDMVRMVKVEGASAELCGGTHCARTGKIGSFRIISEGSAAANVRRIEAVTGMVAVHRARERDALLSEAARAVGSAAEELPARIEALRTQLAEARKAATQAAKAGSADVRQLLAEATQVGPARLVVHRMDGAPPDAAKGLVDDLVARGEAVVALAAAVDEGGKIQLFAKADEALMEQGAHAGNLVREVATACGGGGGGKPTFAQAGGRDASRLDEALAMAKDVLAKQLDAGSR